MQKPSFPAAEPAEPKGLSWGLESRLQFIDFRLRWERRINRMDLTEHFGISVPQASLDISKYMELAPSNLTYDRSSKTYTAAQSFHPLYQRSSAQRYLAELLATKMGIVEPTASFIGSAPETDWAPSPWRTDRKSTRLNSSHTVISYAVFCLKKKTNARRQDSALAERAPRSDTKVAIY